MTSLTFDLKSDQEKLPENRKNPFTGKKVKTPSGEQQRRIPLRDGQSNRCHLQKEQSFINTFNKYDSNYKTKLREKYYFTDHM